MTRFTPTDPALYFSRQDNSDPRLGDLVLDGSSSVRAQAEVAVLGYPDDEGIALNGGRPGARLAPVEIRRWLYKMTPHPQRRLKAFCDHGDLLTDGPIEQRHDQAASRVAELLGEGRQVLSLGGGNDYAYADGIAFLRRHQDARPLVINIDAHFDVRPTDKGLNSGTPFYRLLESGLGFDFVEFGIQPQCNSRAHWRYVQDKGGRIVTVEEYLDSGLPLLEFSTTALGELLLKRRPCFLAVDIDSFCLAAAPGASSSWPLGLSPREFYPVFLTWLKRLDVRVLGIYEVSPPLDQASATVKWAAQLAHGFLHDV
jgi:formiminoglutamase